MRKEEIEELIRETIATYLWLFGSPIEQKIVEKEDPKLVRRLRKQIKEMVRWEK